MFRSDVLRECAAATPALFIVTDESGQDLEEEILAICANGEDGANKVLIHPVFWNSAEGVKSPPGLREELKSIPLMELKSSNTPLGAIQAVFQMYEAISSNKELKAIPHLFCVFRNFHLFWNTEVLGRFEQAIVQGKIRGITLALSGPSFKVPVELEKQFRVIRLKPPDKQALAEIASTLHFESSPEECQKAAEVAQGLTRQAAESAFSVALATSGRLDPEVIWQAKAEELKKGKALTLYRGNEKLADLGGMANLKSFLLKSLTSKSKNPPRGVVLVAPPGTGKSFAARAVGSEVGLPTIEFNVGELKGSLVGESERNCRRAIDTIEAFGRCILVLQEIEKLFAGFGSGYAGDGGATENTAAMLLNWMQDRSNGAFLIGTANDISDQKAELYRSGRWDGIFFVDLPNAEEKEAIWAIHLRKYGLRSHKIPRDADWTGAEIEACCRLAEQHEISLEEAAHFIAPIAKVKPELIGDLRRWAMGRAISASYPGLYNGPSAPAEKPKAPRRKINVQDN